MSSPFPSPEVQRLAGELVKLQRQVAELQNGASTATLPRSSMDRGGFVVRDENGTVRQVVGPQSDGSYTTTDVNAPAPPVPSDPVVQALPGGLKVPWDGTFVGDVGRPADLKWVEVHVDLDPAFVATDDTRDAAITTAGASVTFTTDDYVPHAVRLVAVNTSGVRSAPSAAVVATPERLRAGDIGPGSVGTVQLDNGAVTPTKSGTGVTSNLVPDPGFNDPEWRARRATPAWSFVDSTSVGFNNADWAAVCGPTTGAALQITSDAGIPVTPGETYFVAFDVARTPSGAGRFQLHVAFFDSTGVPVEATPVQVGGALVELTEIGPLPVGVFGSQDGLVTVPEKAAAMTVVFSRVDDPATSAGQLYVDRVEVRSVSTKTSGARVETSPQGVVVFDDQNQPLASFTSSGGLSVPTASVADSLTYRGTDLGVLLNQRALGEVSRTNVPSDSPTVSAEGEWVRFEFTATSGRSYRVRSNSLVARGGSISRQLVARYTTDGSDPTLSSPTLFAVPAELGQVVNVQTDIGWTDGVERLVKVLLTVKPASATNVYFSPVDTAGFSVMVDDTGQRLMVTGGLSGAPVPQTFSKTYRSTWARAFASDGRVFGALYQGKDPDRQYGVWRSVFGFSYAAIAADLADATIMSVQLYLYALTWARTSGGSVVLGTTAAATTPTSFPSSGVTYNRAIRQMARPDSQYLDLPKSVGEDFRDGVAKSFTLNTFALTSYDSDLYYGTFIYPGQPNYASLVPKLLITYQKAV